MSHGSLTKRSKQTESKCTGPGVGLNRAYLSNTQEVSVAQAEWSGGGKGAEDKKAGRGTELVLGSYFKGSSFRVSSIGSP